MGGKEIFFIAWLACLCCIKGGAQSSHLPSLFDEPEAQNEYQKNAVLKPGESPEVKIKSLIFIKTSVSKPNCYVGEPVLVSYQLYTAISCHSRVTKQVAFNGCSVIEMTSSDEPEGVEKDKGVIYRVQLIRRVQLIPLQAGDLIIPPATVNNDVGFSTPDHPYEEKSYSADVSSDPYTVTVNALPDQPENFSGITGKFTIEAKTDSTEMAAGENNRLQVTITGTGNIEAVTEPKINWPKHAAHFDPSDSQHINRLNFPESGDKTFIFPFIITKKGKTILPEISFTYFNTDLKKFETVTTKEIPLTITAGIKKQMPVVTSSNNLSNQKYLWFVPAIAIAVIAVWLLMNRKQKTAAGNTLTSVKEEVKPAVVKEQEAEKTDYELLLTALSEAEDNKAFFTNAKTLLVSALQFRLSPKQDDEMILLNLLSSKDEKLATQAKQMIAVCNQSLYSPVEDNAARSKIIEQVSELINKLENI